MEMLLMIVWWLFLFPMLCAAAGAIALVVMFSSFGEREPELPPPPTKRSPYAPYAPYAPPAVVRLEPKAPGYLRKWTATRKWHEQQDKNQWMSEFSRLQTAPPGRGSTGGSTAAPVSGG